MKYILILILTAFCFSANSQNDYLAILTKRSGGKIIFNKGVSGQTTMGMFSIDTSLLVGLHKSNTPIEQYSRLDNPPSEKMKRCTTAPTTDPSFTKVILERTYMLNGVQYFIFITAQYKCTVSGEIRRTRLLYYK